MSIFDSLKSLSLTPNAEELLSALPTLVGAYEQGRGRPMGNVMSALGGIIGNHAGMRRQGADLAALQGIAGSINPKQAPLASQELSALTPQLPNLDPSIASHLLQGVISGARTEEAAANKSTTYYNTDTGGYERHSSGEFPDGKLPPNLVPGQGDIANRLYAQKHNVPGKESYNQQMLDTIAKANFGAKDFASLPPKAAEQAYVIAAQLTAQPRADIQLQSSLDRMSQEFANQQTLLNQREGFEMQMIGNRATTPEEHWIQDNKGLSPDQFRSLSPEQREKVMDEAQTKIAQQDAKKAGVRADAVARSVADNVGNKYYKTPVMNSKFFNVDPKTFQKVDNLTDTVGDALKNNYGFVSRTEQPQYETGLQALASLDDFQKAGEAVLPDKGIRPLTDTYLKLYGMVSGPIAGFQAARIHLIPTLRDIARTSRPNQAEIKAAIDALQNVANPQQLKAAVNQAKKAVRNSLTPMIQRGKVGMMNDREAKRNNAAMAVMSTPGTYAPSDPGYSVDFH